MINRVVELWWSSTVTWRTIGMFAVLVTSKDLVRVGCQNTPAFKSLSTLTNGRNPTSRATRQADSDFPARRSSWLYNWKEGHPHINLVSECTLWLYFYSNHIINGVLSKQWSVAYSYQVGHPDTASTWHQATLIQDFEKGMMWRCTPLPLEEKRYTHCLPRPMTPPSKRPKVPSIIIQKLYVFRNWQF